MRSRSQADAFHKALGTSDLDLVERVQARMPRRTEWADFVAAVKDEVRADNARKLARLDARMQRIAERAARPP